MSTNQLTLSDKKEIRTCTQSSYGPEPNLDMYAVWATIQLKFGQELGRANLLLLSAQIRRLLASVSTSDIPDQSDQGGVTSQIKEV